MRVPCREARSDDQDVATLEIHVLMLGHFIQFIRGDGEGRIGRDCWFASLLAPPVIVKQNSSPDYSTSLGPSC